MRAAGLVLLACATAAWAFPGARSWASESVSAVWWASAQRLLAAGRVLLSACGGALLVAATWQPSFAGRTNGWAVASVVLLAAVAGWALPRAAGAPLGWRWLVLAGSAAAVYGCVPETDQMREVGVVVAAGLLAEGVLRVALPVPAYAAAWGFVAWAALFGATGRPSALAGGLFALLPPLALGAVQAGGRRPAAVAVVAGGWVVAALVVARTGGIATSLPPAAGWVVGGAVAASVLTALVWHRSRSPRPAE
ncbi:MAG: hypothetical protein Q7V88_08515 [Actinomycetota bacterium]|nr:hypothetical protein [Actinomycetota bacterium]